MGFEANQSPAGSAPKRRSIRVLVVDDHALIRDGLAFLIAGQPDMEVVAEAADGRESVEQFLKYLPDVTLMDLRMADMGGTEAIVTIRKKVPDARIVVLTTYSGDAEVVRALQAGARGYLLKNAVHKELLETIRAVHAGRKMMSPSVAAELAEHQGEDTLTPNEIEVLRLIAGGLANKEIGARLQVTEEAVKSRVKSILSKLHANDRTHAAMIGLKRGIISL
ncbi:MAG TPA: response regulator transcription factor [Bryobacteraceae bacterium]|jgi:DNA-binding NarL/FixJ family response regulator|nr:response regulator transcription factor [Bryobacteraceae bacterium]